MNFWKFVLAVAIIFSSMPAYSQDHDNLDPVTIAASLNPVPASRTGRNVMVIKGERFAALPVSSIDEFLKYIPGIEVQMRGPAGSQADIVIRGGTFQQVLVVLDGIRINDPNTGHFSAYIPVTPSEIERIEILKGASSAIYGSEAVGGVIHIVTKTFAAKRGEEIKRVSGGIKVGEYGLFAANAGAGINFGNTVVSLGVENLRSDGQPQRGTRGFFNNKSGSIAVRHFINQQLDISIRAGIDDRSFGAQNFYTSFLSDTADEKIKSLWTQMKLSYTKNKNRLVFDAGYKDLTDQFLYNSSSRRNNNNSELLQFGITHHYNFNENTILSSGIQYNQKSINSNDRGDHQRDQLAAFTMVNRHWNNFTLSPAIRIDYYEGRGTEFVPQVNLSYHIQNIQIRASAGKTIRDADFTERFNNYKNPLVTGGSVGNPALLSERSFSYEAGADYRISSKLKISFTAFQRRMKQLIDYVPTPYSDMPRKENLSPSGTFALAKNIGRVITSGLETDFQYQSENLQAGIGLLWLDSEAGEEPLSFYLSSHANFLANVNLSYTYKKIFTALTAVYKNREQLSAPAIHADIPKHSFISNIKAGYLFYNKKILLHVQADNIFNTRNSDLLGAILPGRWFSIGGAFEL